MARTALPHLLDGLAKLVGGALRLAQGDVGRRFLYGLKKGVQGRNGFGAAEAERVQGRARRGAVGRHRIVDKRIDCVEG
jgi:hypothetical protein